MQILKNLPKFYHILQSIDIQLIISLSLIGNIYIYSSMDIITWYISIELYSLSSIILLIIKETKNKINIVIIYFIINAISSIFILLSISLIYISIGVFNFVDINILSIYIDNILDNPPIYIIYIYNFLILSIIIKLGAAPFHLWLLILYDSISTLITLYISIIPKLLYLFVLYNIIFTFNINLGIYIIFSLICGAMIGLNNKRIKKLLASSSIFNLGFLLLGLFNYININYINVNNIIYPINILFYLIIYIINIINIFSILLLYNKLENLKDLKYIKSLSPTISLLILISIFSFIGIPPLAGFYAKLSIIVNSLLTYNNIIFIYIILSIICTLISTNYYLYFIRNLFFFNLNYYYFSSSLKLLFLYPTFISYLLSYSSIFLLIFPIFYFYIINIFDIFIL